MKTLLLIAAASLALAGCTTSKLTLDNFFTAKDDCGRAEESWVTYKAIAKVRADRGKPIPAKALKEAARLHDAVTIACADGNPGNVTAAKLIAFVATLD